MRRPVLVAVLTASAFLVLLLVSSALTPEREEWENPPELFGTRDFIAFWSGTHLFLQGKDPYQSANMLEVEREIMPHMTKAQVFLNPPWSLPLYTLVFWPPFSAARVLWILLNFVFLYGIVHVGIRLQLADDATFSTLTAMTFLPALMTIWMGQATLMVLFFALLSFYFYQQQKLWQSSLSALPVICKPHLVFLFFAWWGLTILTRKQFLWPVLFVLGVLILSGIAVLQLPEAFSLWQQADFSPLIFKTSTLPTRIRNLIVYFTGDVVTWPVLAVPLCSVLLLTIWFLYTRPDTRKHEERLLPPLFAWSIGCAPYAWFYDYAALLPLHLYVLSIIGRSTSGRRKRRWYVYALSPQLLVLTAAQFTSDLGGYYWFPWVFLGLYVIVLRNLMPAEVQAFQDDASAEPVTE